MSENTTIVVGGSSEICEGGLTMDYNTVYVELEYTLIRKNTTQTTKIEAKIVNSADTKLSDWQAFFDTLRKITLALRKIANKDLSFTLVFGRYDYIDGFVTHARLAKYSGYGGYFMENEGCYLNDLSGNSQADYWLDANTDMFESVKEFSDNVVYWDMDRERI